MKLTKKIRHAFRIHWHFNANRYKIAIYVAIMFFIYSFVNELMLKATLMLIATAIYGKN